MINILLHDDWEINGDGTGSPETLMFDPARRILDICDTYGAKYTFYPEIGQQLNMLDAPVNSRWRIYAKKWEDTLKDAIRRGHDVQLHFHPQWIGAKLNKEKWRLDYTKWNTGKIEFKLLDEWIGKGADYLRHLLKPVSHDYELVSYRAGGWMCQPSTNLYKTLKKHEIVCDVSVIKGRYREYEDEGKIDFRNAYSRYVSWEVNPNNFAIKCNGSGLWELPVYNELSILPHPLYLLFKCFRPLYYYKIFKKINNQESSGYSPKVITTSKKRDYYGSFGYMHYKHLLSYIQKVNNQRLNDDKVSHLILVTHSKNFLDYENFKLLLRCIKKNGDIRFSNTRNYIRENIQK